MVSSKQSLIYLCIYCKLIVLKIIINVSINTIALDGITLVRKIANDTPTKLQVIESHSRICLQYQAMNTFCFMFPVACTVAGSARTGNFLGAGDAKSARVSSTVSVVSAGCLSLILGSVLLIVPHNFFPSIFDPDPNVVRETASTIPYLSLYVFADGVQYALNGIIKGCGRQPIVMPIVIISYWLIGLPLAYNFAFIQNGGITTCDGKQLCGIVGLVSGMTIGCVPIALCLHFHFFRRRFYCNIYLVHF